MNIQESTFNRHNQDSTETIHFAKGNLTTSFSMGRGGLVVGNGCCGDNHITLAVNCRGLKVHISLRKTECCSKEDNTSDYFRQNFKIKHNQQKPGENLPLQTQAMRRHTQPPLQLTPCLTINKQQRKG